jgi:hypothetical protein
MTKPLSLPVGPSDTHDAFARPSSADDAIGQGGAQSGDQPATPDEERMRRALGLMHARAGAPRAQPSPSRTDLHGPGHGNGNANGHGATPTRRHRFVQDGEVPVVLVKNSRPHEHTGNAAAGGRVEELEAALGVEQAAREKAERALRAAIATIHELRTTLGHLELGRDEAQRLAAQREAAEAAHQQRQRELEAALAAAANRARTAEAALQAERESRGDADTAVREARSTAAAALARAQIAEADLAAIRRAGKPATAAPRKAAAKPATAPKRAKAAATPAGRAQKPVKWWLNTTDPAKPKASR